MVDAADPAHPESGSPRTTGGVEASLRLERWISVETAVQPAEPRAVMFAVLLVVALGALLRIYRIGAQPLWVDEASSLRFARGSLTQLWSWSTLVDPGNPPLYYSLLHGWLVFGDSEARLRLLSALFGVLTIPLVYALGRTIRDHRLGIVSALLFAISPFQVWYAQEARGYSLLTFGATSAMVGVAFLLRDPERSGSVREAGWAWLTYVLGTTVALLAHDTAVFLPIGANVLMLGWWWAHGRGPHGFLRNWLLAQLAVLCLWGTWLPAYLQQVIHGESYSWIPRPTVGSVMSSAYAIYGGVTRATPYLLEALLVLVLAGLGLWTWKRDRRWIVFALVFALSAPIGELIVSVWRPIFLTQTLIWAAVPLYVTIGAGLLCLRSRVVAGAALVVLIALTGLGLRSYYFLHDKEAWDQAAAYVDQRLQPGDAIVFSVRFLQIPFDYYYSAPPAYSVHEIGLTGTSEDPFVVLDETKTLSRVWLIVSHPQPSTDAVIASLQGTGRLAGLTQLTGVDIYLFELGPA
ncbi:MAG: glycosyltransferase family 39 protein [Actinomycetota bacterium]